VVGAEIVPISRYADRVRGDRPAATCPVCAEPVRFNLGPKKAHHFSHAPNAVCATQSGETAAHLNAKFHIAAGLRDASSRLLEVPERCAGIEEDWECGRERPVVFAKDWDEVHVERGLGSLRPDILLARGGTALAAIEVFATHEVPPEKAAELQRLGVPWIEVRADSALYAGDRPWTARDPLPTLRREPPARVAWRCRSCTIELQQLTALHEKRKREEEAEEAFRARHRRKSAHVVDVYRYARPSFREVFWEVAELRDGVIINLKLCRDYIGGFLGSPIRVQRGPDGVPAARRRLRQRFEGWVERFTSADSHVDHVTEWVPAREMEDVEIEEAYPRRYHREGSGWVANHVGLPPLPKRLQPARSVATNRPLESITGARTSPPWEEIRGRPVVGADLPEARSGPEDPVRRSGRLVDRYERTGEHTRRIAWREVGPAKQTGWFEGSLCWGEEVRPIASVVSPTRDECEIALDEAFHLVCGTEMWSGMLLDSPMEWTSVTGRGLYPWGTPPLRFEWDSITHAWRPAPYFEDLAWE
jgi:hypothetical protein